MRNIKDNMVSLYKMLQSFKLEKFDGTFEEMVELYLEGKTWFGKWWDHVDQYTTLPNVYCLHYETLLEVFYDLSCIRAITSK
jgi:hypothetical protein